MKENYVGSMDLLMQEDAQLFGIPPETDHCQTAKDSRDPHVVVKRGEQRGNIPLQVMHVT